MFAKVPSKAALGEVELRNLTLKKASKKEGIRPENGSL